MLQGYCDEFSKKCVPPGETKHKNIIQHDIKVNYVITRINLKPWGPHIKVTDLEQLYQNATEGVQVSEVTMSFDETTIMRIVWNPRVEVKETRLEFETPKPTTPTKTLFQKLKESILGKRKPEDEEEEEELIDGIPAKAVRSTRRVFIGKRKRRRRHMKRPVCGTRRADQALIQRMDLSKRESQWYMLTMRFVSETMFGSEPPCTFRCVPQRKKGRIIFLCTGFRRLTLEQLQSLQTWATGTCTDAYALLNTREWISFGVSFPVGTHSIFLSS